MQKIIELQKKFTTVTNQLEHAKAEFENKSNPKNPYSKLAKSICDLQIQTSLLQTEIHQIFLSKISKTFRMITYREHSSYVYNHDMIKIDHCDYQILLKKLKNYQIKLSPTHQSLLEFFDELELLYNPKEVIIIGVYQQLSFLISLCPCGQRAKSQCNCKTRQQKEEKI